jgi:serine phosphatase RsbU (regulator of sigma subunit)
MDFSEKELRLQKEDTLILYTDGVIEARHEKEFFGEERLFDLIRAGKAGIPQQNVADIFDAVMSFTKGNLTDDMALLAISLMGEPEQY